MELVTLTIHSGFVLHVLIISVRVGATLLFAPIWGYPGLPQYLRVVLVFSIAAGIAAVIPLSPQAYLNPALVMPAELLIGLLLSAGVRIAFAGLQMGGHLISYHLGLSSVQTIDPQTMNRSSLMADYITLLGYLILLTTNQHHSIFRALANSYAAFPIGSSVTTDQWFTALIEASAQIFIIAWKIALPVFVATFVVELSAGFITRMQPQINVMVLTAPLKIIVGLGVLGASLAFMPRALGQVMETVLLHK